MKSARIAALAMATMMATSGQKVPGADEAIHECRDANGNVVYQGDPCPEAARAPAVQARPGVAPTIEAPVGRAIPAVPSVSAVDAHGDTPEGVLRRFVAAVKSGDRDLAISLLSLSALARLGPTADALPMDTLRSTVDSFTGYVGEGDQGPYWSIRALRAGARPKWVLLARTASGEWKIAGF